MDLLPSVLKHFSPPIAGLSWCPVAGGFSGARVWRGDDDAGSPVVALKAWPVNVPAERLKRIHSWMSQAGRLTFIPSIVRTTGLETVVEEAGHIWDVTRWMPGSPRARPSDKEVRIACAAVAKLHSVWTSAAVRRICPGVANRLRVLREWQSAPLDLDSDHGFSQNLKTLLHRARALVWAVRLWALRALEPWESVPLRVQPCLRDLRGDHVLFGEGELTGIVDFGAMAEDHPGVDLARLLGDYASVNQSLFSAGLQAYREAGGEIDTSDEFVRTLDRTGALCSIVMWLVHVCAERRTYPDTDAVEARIHSLIQRIEHFAPA